MFLASKKKIEFLKPLETNLDSSGTVPNIKLLTRETDDKGKALPGSSHPCMSVR